jgi:hypothetical protein
VTSEFLVKKAGKTTIIYILTQILKETNVRNDYSRMLSRRYLTSAKGVWIIVKIRQEVVKNSIFVSC